MAGMFFETEIEYLPVFKLGSDIKESISMMGKVKELCDRFPGLDCGSCGAPTCKALAEDIMRGRAHERDCVHLLRDYIHQLSAQFNMLDSLKPANEDSSENNKIIDQEQTLKGSTVNDTERIFE